MFWIYCTIDSLNETICVDIQDFTLTASPYRIVIIIIEKLFMSYLKQSCYKPVQRVKKRLVRALKLLRDKVFFKRDLKSDIPVLVYQMGKVGSSSVTNSLLRHYSGIVLQAHYFNSNHKDWRVGRLYRWVIEEDNPLRIISLTREPIGRNVSAFFQNFEKHTVYIQGELLLICRAVYFQWQKKSVTGLCCI